MKLSCAWSGQNILGGSPLWDPRTEKMYWVDVHRRKIHTLNPISGDYHEFQLPDKITSIGLRHAGGLIATTRFEFICIDLNTGNINKLFALLNEEDGLRCNSGKCDRQGRYWAGTMDLSRTHPIGSVYRLDPDHRLNWQEGGFTISDGMGWSPDGSIFYFTDPMQRTIYQYDLHIQTGVIHNRRIFATIENNAGMPNGLTVDSEGCIWSVHNYGWRITRYAPDGEILETIPLPICRPTHCCFGGKKYNQLFITSARGALTPADLAKGPAAGGLFLLETSVTGIPEPYYAG